MHEHKSMAYRILALGLGLVFILSACAQAAAGSGAMTDAPAAMATSEPTQAMSGEPTQAMAGETPAAASSGGETMATPAYFSTPLTDASSGKTFKLEDFKGKVVLVETMAQWCTNCMQQQRQVVDLHAKLGQRQDFVSVGLDIDPHENLVTLKDYVKRNGFDWLYAVSPADMSRQLGNLYGDQFLNPTAAPMLIIDKHGQVHPLPFGIKSADNLMKALQPYLNETS
jgi:peroxiredoxin